MSDSSALVGRDLLRIDAAQETERIATSVRQQLGVLRKRGLVLGLSGGIDSSVVAALAARAIGPERVLGVLMPEVESSSDSLRLGRLVAGNLSIPAVVEDITAVLRSMGCYSRRDEAIRSAIPQYGDGYRSKVVLPGLLEGDRYSLSYVVVESPEGVQIKARLSAEAYRALVAATSFKQRVRKMIEYYHADRLQFAVAGTPNRLEYDQGFFVKNGDGAADLKPIAHLYKSQVYQLADYLGIPDEIQERPPTTDTFSLAQSQEEFYFSVPYRTLDVCLYGLNNGLAVGEVASAAGLTEQQVSRVFGDLNRKRQATMALHAAPLLVEPIELTRKGS